MSGKSSKPPSQRQLRVGEEIRHSLSKIFLQQDFYGSALQGVSITVSEVRISPDLKNATAYVAPLGGEAPEDFTKILNEMAPQLRFVMGKGLKLRYIPKVFFKLDDTFDHAHKIESLLDSVREETTVKGDV